jgi:hypothetical protein
MNQTAHSSPPLLLLLLPTLAALSAEQLINLVDTLVDRNPELADDIAELVPRPTVASVQPLFNSMETKLRESFPYTKWGPGRDDYSFNRVKPVLVELVVSVNKLWSGFNCAYEDAVCVCACVEGRDQSINQINQSEGEKGGLWIASARVLHI